MIKRVFFICFIIGCVSCKRNNDSVPALTGVEYFPTDIGRYWIYSVHEIKYNLNITDTTYNRKDVINNAFISNNTLIYELYRFYKPTTAVDWPIQPDSVWTLSTNQNQIAIKENNIEFIRLVFPLSNGKTWDGNSKNINGPDLYEATNFEQPYTSGTKYYSATVNVNEKHTLNFVFKDYRNRIYAKNIGMVYKKYDQVTYNTDPANIGLQKIDFGKIVEETLIAYGTP